jgi:hypothetical protein
MYFYNSDEQMGVQAVLVRLMTVITIYEDYKNSLNAYAIQLEDENIVEMQIKGDSVISKYSNLSYSDLMAKDSVVEQRKSKVDKTNEWLHIQQKQNLQVEDGEGLQNTLLINYENNDSLNTTTRFNGPRDTAVANNVEMPLDEYLDPLFQKMVSKLKIVVLPPALPRRSAPGSALWTPPPKLVLINTIADEILLDEDNKIKENILIENNEISKQILIPDYGEDEMDITDGMKYEESFNGAGDSSESNEILPYDISENSKSISITNSLTKKILVEGSVENEHYKISLFSEIKGLDSKESLDTHAKGKISDITTIPEIPSDNLESA